MGDSSARRRTVRMAKMICALLILGAIVSALALPSSDQVVPEEALVDSRTGTGKTSPWKWSPFDHEPEQGRAYDDKNRASSAASWAMVKAETECTGAENEKDDVTYKGYHGRKAAVEKCNKQCSSQNFIVGTPSNSGEGCYCEQPDAKGDCDGTKEHTGYNLYKKSDAWVRETLNSECKGDEDHKGKMTLDMCAAACTDKEEQYRGFIYGKGGKCWSNHGAAESWCTCYCELPGEASCTAEKNDGFDIYKFNRAE